MRFQRKKNHQNPLSYTGLLSGYAQGSWRPEQHGEMRGRSWGVAVITRSEPSHLVLKEKYSPRVVKLLICLRLAIVQPNLVHLRFTAHCLDIALFPANC
jgi:hypothetical protein